MAGLFEHRDEVQRLAFSKRISLFLRDAVPGPLIEGANNKRTSPLSFNLVLHAPEVALQFFNQK